MSELKGCKYCNSTAYNVSLVHRDYDQDLFIIKCADCGEVGYSSFIVRGFISEDEREEKYTSAWNELNDTSLNNNKIELCDYLLSDEYFVLLERAILSRIKTTSNNFDKHAHAICLIDKVKLENKDK